MALLGWLFNGKEPTAGDVGERPHPDEAKSFLDPPTRRFFGPSSSSPDGRYRIVWHGESGDEAGTERLQTGRYQLFDREQVAAEGKMTRPIHGAVANNGTFILIDAGQTAELSGSFQVFDVHGRQIILRNFKANIFNCGISDNGHFGACQTCNSNDKDDSGILATFDLVAARELSTWPAESGWPTQYTFPDDGKTIGLKYRDLGIFRYSLSGDFIDREKWEDACLTRGDYGRAILMAETLAKRAGSRMSPELSSRIIASIRRITPQVATTQPEWYALALKVQGTCLEISGRQRDALTCYEEALALSPKIGVKRRANQLRKALEEPGVNKLEPPSDILTRM